jgi:hypothetical protein
MNMNFLCLDHVRRDGLGLSSARPQTARDERARMGLLWPAVSERD